MSIVLMKPGMRHILARLFAAIIISVSCLAIVFGTTARKRTLSVVATTLGGEITFDGQLNDWRFSDVFICRLRDDPDFRVIDTLQTSPCDSAMFSVQHLKDIVVRWNNHDQIQFSTYGPEGLKIRIVSDKVAGMPPGSLFLIPSTGWAEDGAFTFQGTVRLGGEMATGSTDYLLSGHWEALQTGIATSLIRDVTDVVKSGTLVRGSTVDFIKLDSKTNMEHDVISYGSLTPPGNSAAGIMVAVLTEKAPVALRINYYGLDKPAIFKPDWIDTITSNTMLVALVFLLSLIVGILELTRVVFRRYNRDI